MYLEWGLAHNEKQNMLEQINLEDLRMFVLKQVDEYETLAE